MSDTEYILLCNCIILMLSWRRLDLKDGRKQLVLASICQPVCISSLLIFLSRCGLYLSLKISSMVTKSDDTHLVVNISFTLFKTDFHKGVESNEKNAQRRKENGKGT